MGGRGGGGRGELYFIARLRIFDKDEKDKTFAFLHAVVIGSSNVSPFTSGLRLPEALSAVGDDQIFRIRYLISRARFFHELCFHFVEWKGVV